MKLEINRASDCWARLLLWLITLLDFKYPSKASRAIKFTIVWKNVVYQSVFVYNAYFFKSLIMVPSIFKIFLSFTEKLCLIKKNGSPLILLILAWCYSKKKPIQVLCDIVFISRLQWIKGLGEFLGSARNISLLWEITQFMWDSFPILKDSSQFFSENYPVAWKIAC